jgi:rhamnulose-1-phosphate aldolase/alcohol dehydrogenase
VTPQDEVERLLDRCHALGADPQITNYGGGNASAKVDAVDPVSGEAATVLLVKGSGGDLGTLQADGLAALMLDRVRQLRDRYEGAAHEDDMVAMFDYCRCGEGGAAPSIDTAMHAFVDAPHVDHLHPDAIIALAAAADGEALVKDCFGDEVAWVPWRRPGFELGVQLGDLHAGDPSLKGVVLGGHGLTAWGATSDECRERSLELIARATTYLAEKGKVDPFGTVVPGLDALPAEARCALAAALAPTLRGLCSTDRPVVASFRDDDVILDFLARDGAPRLVAMGTSCPDHFLRTKVRPLLLDLAPNRPVDELRERLRQLHRHYREDYAAYYRRHATADSPAMRGADPAIVLVPGVGMWSFGTTAREARIAGEFYVNAINVMRGAESVSTYAPIPESEKFGIEYWSLEEAKLRRLPKPKALTSRVAFITGGASGIGRAIAARLSAEGAAVVVADLNADGADEVAAGLGGRDNALALAIDVGDPDAIAAAFRQAVLAYGGVDLVVNCAGLSISASLQDTTLEQWDQQHRVMARGSFLVSQQSAAIMTEQGMGGDLIYIVSKNSVVAGPNNLAYGAAKADQAHQVRLLAAELGELHIRVNGVNPDGVVQGSGIFANGWGAKRAEVYGVPEDELGEYYASRTLLKTEVLPENVAAAVFALAGGDLALTTGMLVPVDGGHPAAFLR